MQTLEEKDARIESQAKKIRELRNEIQLLKDEKHDLTMSLNDTSKELAYYKADYKRHPHPAGRTDQNWDSRPRGEAYGD